MEEKHHTWLWFFAFLAFVVGDSLTTALGLSRGFFEGNPFGASILEIGGRPGLVVAKAGIFFALYGLYFAFDRSTGYDIDDEAAFFIAGLGLLVTGWNIYIIVT